MDDSENSAIGSASRSCGHLRGEVMVFQPMTILDISNGGAQIETAFPLQLDSLHEFRLSLGDRSVVVKGRIAHCHVGELEEERVVLQDGRRVRGAAGARAAGDPSIRRGAQGAAAAGRSPGPPEFTSAINRLLGARGGLT